MAPGKGLQKENSIKKNQRKKDEWVIPPETRKQLIERFKE
jgi:hypothetical protein